MEIRRQNYAAMERSYGVIKEAYADFERIFGRSYGNPFFEEYMTDDADIVLMGMGTLSISVKVAIREMRKQGKRITRWICAHALVPSFRRGRLVEVSPALCGGRGD